MNRILTIVVAAMVLLAPLQSPAQSPGVTRGATDVRTLSVQAKAEELFERGDYRRAHFIYMNELAPIGDKYAQYMLGYMSLSGLGVEADPVIASAWLRIAAERNSPEFVAVRDDVLSAFDETELIRSDLAYIGLRNKYSDIVLRLRIVQDQFEALRGVSTGSRFGRTGSPITVFRPSGQLEPWLEATEPEIERRMERHLRDISDELGIEPVDAGMSEAELRELEALVIEYVNQVDDR